MSHAVTAGPRTRPARVRSLDGFRGIAVGVVMASHALWWMAGGFLGVDVFFVLSGYLITSLLIAERRRSGRIDLVAFYRRRAARLAPAYLLMVTLSAPILAGPLRDRVLMPLWQALAATAVYAANWVAVADSDALGPIGHTWSLSVEEQFYLLWPLAFGLLVRSGRSLTRWTGIAVAVVVVARFAGWLAHPGPWPYFATFTHSDGLLAGCLVAALLAQPGRRVRTARAAARSTAAARAGCGVLLVLGAVLTVDTPATYLGALAVAVLATTAILWHLLDDPAGALSRLLSWTPLVGIGRISYGLYLYHMPIFQYVQTFRLGFFPTLALEVGITFAVALGSWYLLEQPVQRRVATRWPRASPGDPSGPVATADAVAAVDERIPVPRDPATEPGTDPAERGPGRPVHER